MKIITICRANIGRSQVLAGLLEKAFPHHTILSAGTKVVSETGESRNGVRLEDVSGAEKVIEVLKEEGVDWSGKVRTQLTPEMLNGIDLAIVMAEPEHIPGYLRDHPKMVYWEIADLKKTPIEFHREIREKLKRLVQENKYLFD